MLFKVFNFGYLNVFFMYVLKYDFYVYYGLYTKLYPKSFIGTKVRHPLLHHTLIMRTIIHS